MTRVIEEVPLVVAVQQLRERYHVVWERVLRGELRGRKLNGRWMVERESLARVARERESTEEPAA